MILLLLRLTVTLKSSTVFAINFTFYSLETLGFSLVFRRYENVAEHKAHILTPLKGKDKIKVT